MLVSLRLQVYGPVARSKRSNTVRPVARFVNSIFKERLFQTAENRKSKRAVWKAPRFYARTCCARFNSPKVHQHIMTQDVLEKYFGFRAFLSPGEVITAIAAARMLSSSCRRVAAKRSCYKLPALLLEEQPASLAVDRADERTSRALQRRGISSTIDSQQLHPRTTGSGFARHGPRGRIQAGFIAPERFRSRSFLERRWAKAHRAFFARGTSACMSMWGTISAPRLFRLGQVLERSGATGGGVSLRRGSPKCGAIFSLTLALRERREFVGRMRAPEILETC